ncbi:tetratricopeptide repeat protein [Halodesulfovibrio aestuarii]|uniref:Flp pilus assembly protein TadD, contains TPR repeats n=3 Tax=Halodesulfovibrio aestuarii TaxID=126333 RepID=A0A8G2C8H2_9BACT|nr:tetratricopeptide repeat protein [Halodesulfovibrio aestuarii]SHI81355.1 Flp pilus assembly protein TadD, contains TPR repeats [Halodesulfovibrio aestuarii]
MKNLLSILIVALCFGLLLGGCKKNIENTNLSEWVDEHDKDKKTFEGLEREGDKFSSQNNLEQAYLLYSKALQLKPKNVDLRVKRGNILFRKKLMEKALAEYQAAEKKEPARRDVNLGLGKVYFAVSDRNLAYQYLQKAQTDGCGYWEADALLGIIHDLRGDPLKGEELFKKARECAPNNGDILNNLGTSYLLQGRYEDAVDSFLAAIKAGNTKKRVYNNLGLALVKTKHYQDAFEAFKMASDEARAFNNIGHAYYLQQDYKKAIACFEKALTLHPAYYPEAGENLKRAKAALFSKGADEGGPALWNESTQLLLSGN